MADVIVLGEFKKRASLKNMLERKRARTPARFFVKTDSYENELASLIELVKFQGDSLDDILEIVLRNKQLLESLCYEK